MKTKREIKRMMELEKDIDYFLSNGLQVFWSKTTTGPFQHGHTKRSIYGTTPLKEEGGP